MQGKAVLSQDFGDSIHGYASYNRRFKSELFDRLLRFNMSAFYYDYKDIQLRSTAPPAPPGGSLLFNAASAHIKGVDADFLLAPVHGLTINGGFQYLNAKYADFPGWCLHHAARHRLALPGRHDVLVLQSFGLSPAAGAEILLLSGRHLSLQHQLWRLRTQCE